jgi:O-antigen/teichoic acid export membrane protein
VSGAASRRIARNTAARAAGEILAKLASLVFFITMARELGAEGLGVFSFALALTGALLVASGFGTDELVAREVARDPARGGQDLSDVTALKAVTSVALLGLACFIAWIGGYSSETQLAVLLVGIGVALEVFVKSWHALFQAHERLGLVSACIVFQRTVTAIAGVIALREGAGVVAASAIFAAGSILTLGVAEVILRRTIGIHRRSPSRARALRLLRHGVPIGSAALLFTLLLRLDVALLSQLAGEIEVGLYSAAFRLVEGTQFIAWAFGAAMLPWLSRAGGGGGGDLARALTLGLKAMAMVLLPIALVFVCFADPIVTLAYGEEFAPSALPLALLGLTSVTFGLYFFSSMVLIANDRPGRIARIVAIVMVQNLACNALIVPTYGADGAAAVALSSGLLLAVLNTREAHRCTGRPIAWWAFAGPAAAGAAMVAVALAVPLPALPAAVLSLLVYTAVLLAFEHAFHRDDVDVFTQAVGLAQAGRSSS